MEERLITVLDVGGVLFEDAVGPKVRDLCHAYRLQVERMTELARLHRPTVDLGEMGESEYWTRLLMECGVNPRPEDLSMEPYLREVPGAQAAIAALHRRGHRLAILSNDSSELSLARRSRLRTPVDTVVISAEVGLVKPDPAIYELLLRRLCVAPHRCTFIDDAACNVAAARSTGMHALQFTGWESLLPVE